MNPCDAQRDQADLTNYLINISIAVSTIRLEIPEIQIQRQVLNIPSILTSLQMTPQNIATLVKLAICPLTELELTSIEEDAKKYSEAPKPALEWIFQEVLLREFYHLLELSWPQKISVIQARSILLELRDAVVETRWPESFYNSAIECPICHEVCITRQLKTHCQHEFCANCICRWLLLHHEDVCPCPLCRTNIADWIIPFHELNM